MHGVNSGVIKVILNRVTPATTGAAAPGNLTCEKALLLRGFGIIAGVGWAKIRPTLEIRPVRWRQGPQVPIMLSRAGMGPC
jgi:hypothetical protein